MNTKQYIQLLEEDLNKKSNNIKVLDVTRGGSKNKQGSWIHPIATTHLAMWISPVFSVKVTQWIEEWKVIKDNNSKYIKELCILKPSESSKKEKILQLKLAKELNADIEVQTPVGYIDLLNKDMIIEIKKYSMWKQALGQILCYSIFYPLKQKVIYLFKDRDEPCEEDIIKDIYIKYDIKLHIITF